MLKKHKPAMGEIIPTRPLSHWSDRARDLTPARLSAILANLDAGEVSGAMTLFDEMDEKDLHLGAVTQTRALSAVVRDRDVIPASNTAQDRQIADFVRGIFSGIPRQSALLCGLMSAVTHGFAVAEIVWDISEGSAAPVEIKPRPQKYFTFINPDDPARILDFPRYLDPERPGAVALPREKFIFHTHYSAGGDFLRAGLYRGISWYYLFTNFTMKDWLTFIDLYGVPLRLGKYGRASDEKTRMALKEAVRSLGSDSAAVISDDTTIEFIHSALAGDNRLFQNAAEFFNRQKSKRILGQTLTTESGSGPGSSGGAYALGKIHDKVREEITAFDCKALDETLNSDLVRPLVDFNFGPRKSYPRIVTRFRHGGSADITGAQGKAEPTAKTNTQGGI